MSPLAVTRRRVSPSSFSEPLLRTLMSSGATAATPTGCCSGRLTSVPNFALADRAALMRSATDFDGVDDGVADSDGTAVEAVGAAEAEVDASGESTVAEIVGLAGAIAAGSGALPSLAVTSDVTKYAPTPRTGARPAAPATFWRRRRLRRVASVRESSKSVMLGPLRVSTGPAWGRPRASIVPLEPTKTA